MARTMPNGGITLDPFMGSGTSSISADEMNISYHGCELDKDYYEAACKRFKNHIAQTKLFHV